MSHFPSLVTETVLKFAAAQETSTYPSWKYNLRLLSVCKEWRYLGQKLVYNTAFISDTSEYTYYANNHHQILNLAEEPLQTNIDLVYQTNSTRYVKRLDMLLIQNNINGFHQILDYLQKHLLFDINNQGGWQNIRELNIRWFKDDNEGFEENSIAVQEIISFSNRLITSMPNICKLYMRKYDSDRTTLLLFNQLAAKYSNQLQYLYSSSSLRFSSQTNYESLTHLRIPYETPNNVSQALPKVTIKRLQFLELFNLSSTFTWNMLLFGSSNRKYSKQQLQSESEFPNLKYLKLVFSVFDTDQPIDQNDYTVSCKPMSISFPKLTTLIVNGNYVSCPNILIQKYPQNMQKVDLQLNTTCLSLMKHIGFRYIEDLSISISTLSNSEEEETSFYISTNYFFGDNANNMENKQLGPICKNSAFVINSLSYLLNPKLISWSNVSSITFTGTVHVSVLLRILKQVKTLEKLVVWSLDMDVDITSQEKHTGINAHSSLGFLNKSVKSFSVFDYKKTDADYCIGLNMLNLVLCLPRLQRLTSAEMVIESIKKYTEYCQLNKAIGCDCNIHLGKVEFIKT